MITIDGISRRVLVDIENMEKTLHQNIREGWFKVGAHLQRTASKEILRRPKSGRVYYIRTAGGRRRRHVASAPGETHANLSGALRRSIGWKVTGWQEMEFGYGVTSPAPKYAPYIELGTSKIDPRPSLKNAIDTSDKDIEGFFDL